MAATLAVAGVIIVGVDTSGAHFPAAVFAATLFIAVVGFADDLRSMPVVTRLVLQASAVAAILLAAPADLRIVPTVPLWIERGLLLLAGLWFVNLVNFMDGIDWMTVVEVIPIAATFAALGFLGALPSDAVVLALALGGAMIGFAYFNRPTAKLFLGDVGSLPIGLILGFVLLLTAGGGHLAAAVLAPLYYLADATITLFRRIVRGEPFWEAHRSHFYQRATDKGFSTMGLIARVFAVNVGLGVLATLTVIVPGRTSALAALAVGVILVGWLLGAFTRGRQ